MNESRNSVMCSSKRSMGTQSDYILFLAKLDGVKTYMRLRRVPNSLQNKVIKWFDYLWLTQKSSDEERAVSCLPGKIYYLKNALAG